MNAKEALLLKLLVMVTWLTSAVVRPQNLLFFVESILQTKNRQSLFYLSQKHTT